MVNVYKTNVNCDAQASAILENLRQEHPDVCVNFDLEDCDKILRVEGVLANPAAIITLLQQQGFYCDELPD